MAISTIQDELLCNCGDYPNGTSLNNIRNGFYRIIPNARPSEGVPTNFDYCVLFRFRQQSGYMMAILTDIYGRLAIWSTQNNSWVVR